MGPNQALERTADRRENLLSMALRVSILKSSSLSSAVAQLVLVDMAVDLSMRKSTRVAIF